MPATADRRRAIRALIEERPITSQSELVELLDGVGFGVTQATVSRDLYALGAGKDGDRYVLGEAPDPDAVTRHLHRTVADWARAIIPSGNLIVIHTPPGAGQVVAAAVDDAEIDGVVGSVAGDDTVLVVVAEGLAASEVIDRLRTE